MTWTWTWIWLSPIPERVADVRDREVTVMLGQGQGEKVKLSLVYTRMSNVRSVMLGAGVDYYVPMSAVANWDGQFRWHGQTLIVRQSEFTVFMAEHAQPWTWEQPKWEGER